MTSTDNGQQDTAPETHRCDYPHLCEWLEKADSKHWLVGLLDAERDPESTPPTQADMVLDPLEKLAKTVADAAPEGLAKFLSSRFRDTNAANMWSARLELLCAAHLAIRRIPFEFGGTGEADLIWNPGISTQGWLEIHRGGFSVFDDLREDLDRELAEKDASLVVRLDRWPLEATGRNSILNHVAQAAERAVKEGTEQPVALPELGTGVSAVVRPGPGAAGLSRVSVEHGGLAPSAEYLDSLAQRLARKVNVDKAGQARKGAWSPQTVLLIDISTARHTRLLGQDGLAAWLESVPIEWDDLPFAGVAVSFSQLHDASLSGTCRYKPDLAAADRAKLESVLSAIGLPATS